MLKKKVSENRNKILFGFGIICIVLGIAFFRQISLSTSFLYSLIFNKNIELKKESDGSVNILLLGIGGGTHEGPDLTDTLIFAHVNPTAKSVELVSIPRDLWIPDISQRINTAYSIGQDKDKKGKILSRAVVQKVIGEPVDYVFVLDFQGFVKLVDYLGGIEVDVKRDLTDLEYPIEGKENDTCGHKEEELLLLSTASSQLEAFPCRYRKVHFEKGLTHMNGNQSLDFVRSRHAIGEEGNDFARSQRQQETITAIEKKVFSLGIILNPVKVFGIYNIISQNIDMDIKPSEFDDFIKLAKKERGAKVKNTVLDFGSEQEKRNGILIHPDISAKQDYEWVLIPRAGDGDFSEIHAYIDCIIKGNVCTVNDKGIGVSEVKN